MPQAERLAMAARYAKKQLDANRCTVKTNPGPYVVRCELQAGHDGAHSFAKVR